MKAERQLTFDLGHRPALEREDFLVAPSNQLAVEWVDRWPDWPAQAMAIYGPAGSGKTHLCQVWRRSSQAVEISAEDLRRDEPPVLLGSNKACVAEGLAGAVEQEPELAERMLHLYNMILERGGYLLVSDRRPPARWLCGLADLRSRLTAMQAVALGEPDETLLQAVLVKLFADRQLTASPEVVQFLAPRIERSLDVARQIVAAIDAQALAARREITIPLARLVLSEREEHGGEGFGKEED